MLRASNGDKVATWSGRKSGKARAASEVGAVAAAGSDAERGGVEWGWGRVRVGYLGGTGCWADVADSPCSRTPSLHLTVE